MTECEAKRRGSRIAPHTRDLHQAFHILRNARPADICGSLHTLISVEEPKRAQHSLDIGGGRIRELPRRGPATQSLFIDRNHQISPSALKEQLSQKDLPRRAAVAPGKRSTLYAVPAQHSASQLRKIAGRA